MNALETPKAIAMAALFTSALTFSGAASAAAEDLRCDVRALQIEAKVLRCVGSCRALEDRRHSFNEDRCLTKCESNYSDSFAKLLCPADRRLVRAMDGASAVDLRCEARQLQELVRSMRCSARCEDSTDPDACVADCDAKYVSAAAAGQCAE